ncbi:MAG: DUF1566 domain-containing protein, partial [Muribaculaceae bacterium]|nr:DUF1566 domain-containing protein [Muribaculaceae bacterium]
PNDVDTVELVTFTDGLDQGSLAMTDKYEDKLDYLNDVSDRISSSTVAGKKIVAYTIGLRGSDVSDNALFTDNLKKLSNPSSNGKEVSAMSAVNAEFEAIAKTLSESNYVQKLTLKCPVVSNGAKIRFTLDGTSASNNVNSAKFYIEGTYNYRERALENIVYGGMDCGSGEKVYGVQEGIFVTFDFSNIRTNNNVLLKPANIREWEYVSSSSKWQINSEFDTENGAEVEVTRSSAAIMLVLDCSSSLKNDFSTVQTSAKNFINVLYKAIIGSEIPTPGPDPTLSNNINGHEYVDLGLPSGLKWATCNVGASSPTDYGDYFAWGEIKPKSNYTVSTSITANKSIGDFSGNVNYDAARANWGGTWRMPSDTEMRELVNKCTWVWTSKSGVKGCLVKGPNGNEIFLPATGEFSGESLYNCGFEGNYWSSTPDHTDYDGDRLEFDVHFDGLGISVQWSNRPYGYSVRPVSE